ncbi:MAG TPA: DUF3185 family protein [Verrucomicrobiae bacterium]|nr:DUF3185 family protein [Verrucomicrobiae bacterium]
MQKLIGVICLAVGILLLVWAHDMSQSLGSQVKQIFTGSPQDRATYFYIGGVVLVIFGVFQSLWPGKK